MPRKTRAEMQADTKEKLLESARLAFGRKGFAGATIDDIAEGAGFSRGAFYSNFTSKEDVAVALMGQQMELDVARVAVIAQAANGPPETMLERIRVAFATSARITDWELLRLEMLLLAQRNPEFAAQCQTLYKPQRERVAEVISQIFARIGRAPPADTALLAYTIMTLRLGAALLHAAAGPVPLGDIVALVFRSLAAIAPPADVEEARAA